jgi:hypothetical protein
MKHSAHYTVRTVEGEYCGAGAYVIASRFRIVTCRSTKELLTVPRITV